MTLDQKRVTTERELFAGYRNHHERIVVLNVPYTTDVGLFVVYRVPVSELPRRGVTHQHEDAISYARGLAIGHELNVLDVAQAAHQDDDAWLVELRVEGKE